jgi:tetratricopeptide (TPR) repeat protein
MKKSKTALKPLGKKATVNEILQHIVALQTEGKFKESKPLCDALATNGIDSADFLHLYGLAYRGCDDFDTGLQHIQQAAARKPNDTAILNSLGVLLLQMKRPEEALVALKKAADINPDLFDPWNNMGNVLRQLERYQEAELALKRARKIDNKRIEPLLNMALILTDMRLAKHAEKFMDKVLELANPVTVSLRIKRLAIANKAENFNYVEKHYPEFDHDLLSSDEKLEIDQIWARFLEINNRGDEAIALLEPWLERDTKHSDQLLSVLGMLYSKAGQLQKGIDFHKKLLEKSPDHITARWNLSLLQLVAGDVEEGFLNYETRWKWREFPSSRRQFDIPRWEGQNLTGKKLLVWREQGIGDEVRFSSLIPELRETGAVVTVECSTKMVTLFKNCFPWALVRPEGSLNCKDNIEYEGFDYQIPMGSLTPLFRKSLHDFYDRQQPWIPRIKSAEAKVRNRLGVKSNQILVGICWRSSNQAPSRNRHYLLVEELAPLQIIKNAIFVSTQYDECMPEIERVRELGLPFFHYVNVNQKDDLLSSCGLLGACDIVISANVSVADFASGLGVPVIRIGPKHDAIRLGTENIPWYPTCKYFEIEPGQTSIVIERIITEWPDLIEWVNRVTTSGRVVRSDQPLHVK